MNNDKRTPGSWTVNGTDIECGDDIIAVVETGNKYTKGDALLIAACPELEDFAHAFMRDMAGIRRFADSISREQLDTLYAMAEKAVMKSKGLL